MTRNTNWCCMKKTYWCYSKNTKQDGTLVKQNTFGHVVMAF